MKLEVGMYVRTTYGIGKITDMHIIYSDDGAFWHISCLTEHKTKDGYIQIGLYAERETYGEDGDYLKVFNYDNWNWENKKTLYEEYYTSSNKKLIDDYLEERGIECVCYINHKKNNPRGCSSLYDDHKFIKASFNIIDLIEVGDYVNGYKVYEVDRECCRITLNGGDYDSTFRLTYLRPALGENMGIKSIVTKEQFEAMKYEVK